MDLCKEMMLRKRTLQRDRTRRACSTMALRLLADTLCATSAQYSLFIMSRSTSPTLCTTALRCPETHNVCFMWFMRAFAETMV
jgi:hypothetical protein